ncbi:hypothetical protein Q8F55_003578 [Vanrija albida]|uniref:Extracellular membrane protein CFEM domain-containing protein n=1 Tax=Vanrija albida TaxID=181172 RepID=A0ABR3Q4D0_9TREE
MHIALATILLATLAAADVQRARLGVVPPGCEAACATFKNTFPTCDAYDITPACAKMCEIAGCGACILRSMGGSDGAVNSSGLAFADACAAIGTPVALPPGYSRTGASPSPTAAGGGGAQTPSTPATTPPLRETSPVPAAASTEASSPPAVITSAAGASTPGPTLSANSSASDAPATSGRWGFGSVSRFKHFTATPVQMFTATAGLALSSGAAARGVPTLLAVGCGAVALLYA